MAVKKCYCEKQFQDTAADRKRHVLGIQQQQAKARWDFAVTATLANISIPFPTTIYSSPQS
ncbi:hypothetical protein GYH30_055339 [Glycine max]|nr:hypothetical protein GYH30_055339 [Glycine max]